MTVADAHAHDKADYELSYEELYGSTPENMKEETASIKKTNEFIGEQIQEPEKMELKEQEAIRNKYRDLDNMHNDK